MSSTSRIFFARLLDPTSGLVRHTSGLPKILPRLRLTLLTMLGLWGVPHERPRQADAPRTTPTYYLGGRVYVCCWFMTETRQQLQVQIHLEMPRILVQLGHIQRT